MLDFNSENHDVINGSCINHFIRIIIKSIGSGWPNNEVSFQRNDVIIQIGNFADSKQVHGGQ